MKRQLNVGLPIFFAAVFALIGGASAADWQVVRMSGDVVVEIAGARPVSLSSGEILPAGGTLKTGDNSRAVLMRDQQQMIVGANAVVAIPAGANDQQFTTVLQEAGVVEFTVDKRKVKHFAVQTPYLAAVVKGTHFAVGVFKASGVVKVAGGVVEVTDLLTGEFVDVFPGQEAAAKMGQGLSVSGEGKIAPVQQGTPGGARAATGLGVGTGIGSTVSAAVKGVGAASALGLGNGGVSNSANGNVGGNSGGSGNSNAGGNGKP
jgi:FecR protein